MKKLIALLTAMLMIALPVLSQAETGFVAEAREKGRRADTVMTLHSLNEELLTMMSLPENIVTILKNVLAAVSFTVYEQEQEIGAALNLSDKPVVDLQISVQENGAFLRSSLLNEKPIVIRDFEHFKGVMDKLLTYFADDLGVTEEGIDQAIALMKPENLEVKIPTPTLGQTIELPDMDMSPFTALTDAWQKKIVTAAVTAQPADCDPVDTLQTLTLTAEDMNQLLPALVAFFDLNPELIEMILANVTVEGIDWEKDKSTIAQTELFTGETKITMYLAGETLKKAEFSTVLNVEEQPTVQAVYTVKDGVHSFNSLLANMMQFQFAYASAEEATQAAQQLVLALAFVSEGGVISLGANILNQELTNGLDAAQQLDVTLNFAGMDALALTVLTQTSAPQPAMSGEGAIDLAAMNDEELTGFINGVITNANQVLSHSLMMLLMGQ